jgi:hypothetical protein
MTDNVVNLVKCRSKNANKQGGNQEKEKATRSSGRTAQRGGERRRRGERRLQHGGEGAAEVMMTSMDGVSGVLTLSLDCEKIK